MDLLILMFTLSYQNVRNLTITSSLRTVVDVENLTLRTRIKAVPLLIEILALPSEQRRNLGGIRH